MQRVEVAQVLERLHALGRLFLRDFENGVDVFVCDCGILCLEHLLGAELDHRQHLVRSKLLVLVRQPSGLDDEGVHAELDLGFLDDPLLDRVRGDEPEDPDLLLLADPVRAVLRLEVHLRVPVRVVENDDVGRVEVDPEATRAG